MHNVEKTLANNLKFLMASTPSLSTQSALEEKSGVGQATIGRILRLETEAKIGTVKDLAKAFKLNPAEILDPAMIERISGNSTNISGTSGHTGPIPLISWVTAGMMCEVTESIANNAAEEWLESPFHHSSSTFCLRIRGESMWPEYKDGEIIQIDPEVPAQHNDDVVVRTPDGKATFKRLQENEDGRYLLAINPDFPNRIIRVPENSVICGVCTGSWTDRRKK